MKKILTSICLLLAACSSDVADGGDSGVDSGIDSGMVGGECTAQEADIPGNACFPGKADPCKVSLSTGYAGDEYCLEPPVAGYQMHIGPSNYEDPAEIEKWVLPPGGYPVGDSRRESIGAGPDINWCYFMRAPNEQDIFMGESFSRMRPGSHHYISFALPSASEMPDSTAPQDCSSRDAAIAGGANFLSGATRSVQNVSMFGDAPEDKGLGSLVLARQQLSQNLHFVNIGDTEVLQEIWINTVTVPTESVTDKVRAMTWIGGLGMNVPYGAHQLVESSVCEAPPNIPEARMLGVTAHAHANTLRVSMYQLSDDGTKSPIFDDFNWEEPTVWRFGSTVTNPAPDVTSSKSGASLNGVFYARPGDKFGWECEVINKSPDKNNLVFSDKAYSGEMCNIFGMYSSPIAEVSWSCYSLTGGKDIAP
jgi:hypothetical protein